VVASVARVNICPSESTVLRPRRQTLDQKLNGLAPPSRSDTGTLRRVAWRRPFRWYIELGTLGHISGWRRLKEQNLILKNLFYENIQATERGIAALNSEQKMRVCRIVAVVGGALLRCRAHRPDSETGDRIEGAVLRPPNGASLGNSFRRTSSASPILVQCPYHCDGTRPHREDLRHDPDRRAKR
jgi:hypothetical protein